MAGRRSPMDHTGTKAEELAAAHKAELERRQDELTTMVSVQRELEDEVVDLTADPAPSTDEVDYLEEPEYVEGDVVIRALVDLEQVTIGVGTEYNFKAGRRYKVPAHVARHLASQNLIY